VNQTRKTALWKKLALSISLPIALFAGGELALRVCGFGEPLTFFIRDDRPDYLRTNPAFTSLVFPASFGLKPENFRIAQKKDPNAIRVFVLGESAAMGVPEPGFGLAPQLCAQWQAAYPDRKIEVYNLGVTAINSHCVRLIADEALRLEPDLLVLYMGNNEVVGPYGPSSGAAEAARSLPLVRLSLWVRSTRTGQLVQRLVSKLSAQGNGAPEWRGMEMFTGRTVTAGDPRLKRVYDNFSANLSAILSAAARRNTPVALCTVAVNVRDCSPFASVHRPGLPPAQLQSWADASRAADDAIELDQLTDARNFLQAALAIDPEYSETHYKLGSVLEHLNEHRLARSEYFSALQLDALRFRADANINEIIRHAGRAFPNVTLVDAAAALGSSPESAHELTGRDFFFEHVHLTWEGNYALASTIRNAAALRGERAIGPALDIDAAAKRVGFTEAGRAEQLRRTGDLTQRPPFTGQVTYSRDRALAIDHLSSVRRELQSPLAIERCLSVVAEARANDSTNPFLPFHLAQLQAQLGRWNAALESNRQAAELAPESPELLAQQAYLLIEAKDFKSAEAILLQSQKRFAYYFQTYGLLGQLWAASGRIREGVTWFAELVKKMPESRAALEMYAQLLQASGAEAQAEAVWKKVLAIEPDSESSLMPLVRRRLASKRADEAVDLLERALRYNPRNLAVSALLERIYDQRGEVEKRIRAMRVMIESGPVSPELFLDLGDLLTGQKLFREADISFYRAIRAARASGDEAMARAAAVRREAMRRSPEAN
jgi:tetratricopeptide (TPR) repeat protein